MYINEQLKFGDMHTHTTFSDGKFTPSELVAHAAKQNISFLSITDHDSVAGIDEAIEAAFTAGIEIIPGIELNTDMKDTELHILGYYFDYKNPEFIEKLDFFRNSRIERMKMMISKLIKETGRDITLEEVRQEANKMSETDGGSIGRPHLARMMVKKKIVDDERSAFDRFIGNGKPCYVEVLSKLAPVDAIKFIIDFGGVPVLAHPGFSNRDHLIPELVAAGLMGLEVFHSNHDNQMIARYEKMANEMGLLMTGGSDCHGPRGSIPAYCGNVKLPIYRLNELKKRHHDMQKKNS
ncbi:MAG TPA: PHP domain-containing protein [Candidatus Wallbacteria bacterium]|nr:PHP domain-containing protein [Candidatus Wallbacteria bacterium]